LGDDIVASDQLTRRIEGRHAGHVQNVTEPDSVCVVADGFSLSCNPKLLTRPIQHPLVSLNSAKPNHAFACSQL
jgi:hypothetical protein